ncbi:MAG: hypothetical protein SF162_11535 [bacterium]|nr:hypothetical protein [bacterium]
MSAVQDLLDAIFEDARPPFYDEFAGWVRDSRRFKAFATAYQAKIRAKLKQQMRQADTLRDLRAELAAAVLMLRDERLSVEYEKRSVTSGRAPDYTLTYRTHTPFNVEVRRIHPVDTAAGESDDADSRKVKLMAILCEKVGQMPPGMTNFLWLADERAIAHAEIAQAGVTLRTLAEHKDEAFFTRRGFASAAAFLKQYQALSGIVHHLPGQITLYPNPVARYKPSPDIALALTRLLP